MESTVLLETLLYPHSGFLHRVDSASTLCTVGAVIYPDVWKDYICQETVSDWISPGLVLLNKD